MNRRDFFKALGAGIAIVVVKPVPVVHKVAPAVVEAVEADWIAFANTVAFNLVGESLPEHRNHYRQKALASARRFIASQHRI